MNEKEFISEVIPLLYKLLKICTGILGKSEQAKDAIQEILIKLWNDRAKLEGYTSIEAFARSITRNHCLDILRLKKNEVDIGSTYLKLVEGEDADYESELIEKLGMVRAALLKLNDNQQQVFTMRDVEGMEFDEIAKSLGITQENVRVTLSRARCNIRQIIADEQKRKLK